MSTERGWVIVGTGLMGRLFPPDLVSQPGNKIVGILSRNIESAHKLAKFHNLSTDLCFTDFDAAVNRPEVHVVYLATPPSEHARQTVAAVKFKKAVLCEKPFTVNKKDALEAVEAARNEKVFLLEALFSHYTPSWVALRQIFRGKHAEISLKDLGKPLHLEAHIGIPQSPETAPALFDASCAGGALGAVSVYPINLCYAIFGVRPKSFTGRITKGPSGVDEENDVEFQYEGNATAHWTGHIRKKHAEAALVKTENGQVEIAAPWWCPSKITVRVNGKPDHVIDVNIQGKGYGYEANEVNRCLDAGLLESEVFPLDMSLDIMDLMDELRSKLGN